ncbi:MAG: MoxR family ATPase [Dehalococcoidales bacterium]|nr:MoxR family ATPase [Dehalococcoidales bacterium]
MDSEVIKARQKVTQIIDNIEKVIIGKRQAVELTVITLVSQGHLLIEDTPGVGKTMLARSLAKSIDCTFKRIQFTPDMLPGDITGVTVYNQKSGEFEFRPGPIMAQVVLADEINRGTPKVQSALLQPMEERQVTVDGSTYSMPTPFHVVATRDPFQYQGIFPLPEAQLDRFLLRISLGYPSAAEESLIMERQQFTHPLEQLAPVADASDVVWLQETVKSIYMDDLVKQYIVSLVGATRQHPLVAIGSSPRGSLSLFRTAQARAVLQERDFVLPDDVKALAEAVLAHRLILPPTTQLPEKGTQAIIAEILETVPVPGALPRR